MIDADREHARNAKPRAWLFDRDGLKRDSGGPHDGVSSKFPRSWSSERCPHRDIGLNRKSTPFGQAWWSECMAATRKSKHRDAWARVATTTTKTGPDGKDSDR